MVVHFIGGIHGAGKSTLCERLRRAIDADYARASELLRFEPTEGDSTGKAVTDVEGNQARLVAALHAREMITARLLLDGHFCLLNSAHEAAVVPLDTFAAISPVSLTLIETDLDEVRRRLEVRDGRRIEPGLVQRLADCEKHRARQVASTLAVPLQTITRDTNDGEVLSFLMSAESSTGIV